MTFHSLMRQQALVTDWDLKDDPDAWICRLHIRPGISDEVGFDRVLDLILRDFRGIDFDGAASGLCWLCDGALIGSHLAAAFETATSAYAFLLAMAEAMQSPIVLLRSESLAIVFSSHHGVLRINAKQKTANRRCGSVRPDRPGLSQVFKKLLSKELTGHADLIRAIAHCLGRMSANSELAKCLVTFDLIDSGTPESVSHTGTQTRRSYSSPP